MKKRQKIDEKKKIKNGHIGVWKDRKWKKREGRKNEVRELRYQNGKIKLGEVVEKRE